ncbi:MAG: hypothetical protein LIO86_01215 [Lachnospiraceae bacterium]|nr:hypothetical protein [Lachnospiraceae bacterium]
MKKNGRKLAELTCILALLASPFAEIPVRAGSSITISYTSSTSVNSVISALNQQFGLSSSSTDWTWYTTTAASLTCTSFQMEYDGEMRELAGYLGDNYSSYRNTDAYWYYESYMDYYEQQESISGYYPLKGASETIPSTTVDLGEAYYSMTTPEVFEGYSRTIITYTGTRSWSGFGLSMAAGKTYSMMYGGNEYTVSLVAASSDSTGTSSTDTSTTGSSSTETSSTGTSSTGSSSTGTSSTGSSSTGTSSTGSSSTEAGVSLAADDSSVIPGRTDLSVESALRLAGVSESVPTLSESSDSDAVVAEETGKWNTYETTDMTGSRTKQMTKVFTYALGAVALVGVLRILLLLVKRWRGF